MSSSGLGTNRNDLQGGWQLQVSECPCFCCRQIKGPAEAMRARCYSEGSVESPRTRILIASRCQPCTESASCYIPSHTGQNHMDVFSCVCVHTCVSILFIITQNQNSDNRQFRLEKKKHPTRQPQLLAHPQDSHVSLKKPLIFHNPPFPHP